MEATMEQPHEPTPQELAKLFDGTGEASSPTSNGQPSASEPADDEKPSDEPREDVPEIIVELINHFEGIFVPPGLVVEPDSPHDRMLKGRCVACAARLGPNTTAFVTKHGVTMLFCGGVCTADFAVLGFLAQTYDDITEQLRFRGGQGGN